MSTSIVSSTPSRGRHLAVLSVVLVAMLLLTPGAARGGKYLDSFFGGNSATPALGGLFSTSNSGIGDVAVNSSGAGGVASGTTYVVDRGNNRIQAFDTGGAFLFAIGRDVVQSGGTGNTNERQVVAIGGSPTGGSFTLTFGANTTAPVAFDAPASGPGSVQAALEAIPSVGAGNASVTGSAGGPYTVEFVGARANVDQSQMTANGSGLTPSGTVTVTTAQDGASFEKCTVAAQCKVGTTAVTAATSRGNAGTFNIAQGIDVDQATGHIFVSERTTNRRIQEFTANGDFVRAFGWEVVASGPGNTGGFETCNATAGDICQASTAAGSSVGQFASNSNGHGLAVAPVGAPNEGRVYVADPGNQRVQRFAVPASPTAAVTVGAPFGVPAIGTGQVDDQFGLNWPRDIAADADGVVYATSLPAGANAMVKRFDTTANAFMAMIGDGTATNIPLGGPGGLTALEIDPSNGHLLVGRNTALGIQELDVAGKPATVGPGRLVDSHAVGLLTASTAMTALGVRPSTGELLVATSSAVAGTAPGAGTGNRVLVFDATGAEPPPLIEVLPAEDIGSTTATLRATVNPNGPTGFPTSYRFEVSKDGIDWIGVTSDALVGGTGEGGSSVAIEDLVTGLEPGAQYRVRVVATRAAGAGVTSSAEIPLLMDVSPPTTVTAAASQVSDTRARIAGVVNPGGLPTTYWFEWGDDDYGNSVPVPAASVGSSGIDQVVGQALSGLDPESVYHYRLCARNSLSATPVCGTDQAFTTRPSVAPPDDSRVYEMVLPPDKPLRRGGSSQGPGDVAYAQLQTGMPSTDGGAFYWSLFAGATDAAAGHGFTLDQVPEIRRRGTDSWSGDAVVNVAHLDPINVNTLQFQATSANLGVHTWGTKISLFPTGSLLGSRIMSDAGGPRSAGWYPWLDPAWFNGNMSLNTTWNARIDDDGERLVAQMAFGSVGGGGLARDIVPADDSVDPAHLTPPQTAGRAVLASSREADWRPADLVNECTGAGGGDATEIPTRIGTGISTDLIGTRECAEGSPTHPRGAGIGSQDAGTRLGGTGSMAMSDDGNRIFFLSPDPNTASGLSFPSGGNGQTGCVGSGLDAGLSSVVAVDDRTDCPAQLFVRQYDDAGNPTVRWISRAEDALFTAPQQIGEFGSGVAFEGASRDGRVVYFRTNAPLTLDDPNGGNSLTNGSASSASWDLYRYELPGDNNLNPGNGQLERISGGPNRMTVATDPNTNCAPSFTATCGGETNGQGGAARFVSDSGEKVYFVTAAPIGAADDDWNEPPSGSSLSNVPGGTAVANGATRNLYAYDATKTGEEAYRFIARIPFGTNGLSACASAFGVALGPPVAVSSEGGAAGRARLDVLNRSCVHGSSSGDAIVFQTSAQLTPDDNDTAFDVYVYEADADALTRLTSPPPGGAAYPCVRPDHHEPPLAFCNGDLGFDANGTPAGVDAVGTGGLRHWNVAEDEQGNLKAVYFQSQVELVDTDINGDTMDTYEWRRGDGRLSLVSPGTSPDAAFYSGNSLDGRDVFFVSRQMIDAREIDPGDRDAYDARVGGGFPLPATPPDLCDVLGGHCQSTAARSGDAPPIMTDGPGDGSASPTSRPLEVSIQKPNGHARRRAARLGALPLLIEVSRPGALTVRAFADLGNGTRLVGRRVKRLRRAGTASVRVRFDRRARRRLLSGRPLMIDIVVTPAAGHAKTLSVLLQRGER